MIRATLDEVIPLQIQLNDGQTALYGRAKVYDSSGALFVTLPLSHIDNGLYGTSYTFISPGHYTVVYQMFLDAGLTIPSEYDIEAETVEANSDKTNILRILGMTHDNTVIDQQTYNLQGNLLTSRIRQYETKAQAELAGASGLLNTWSMVATFSGDKLTKYVVVRE
jgi:hypothetical protein